MVLLSPGLGLPNVAYWYQVGRAWGLAFRAQVGVSIVLWGCMDVDGVPVWLVDLW